MTFEAIEDEKTVIHFERLPLPSLGEAKISALAVSAYWDEQTRNCDTPMQVARCVQGLHADGIVDLSDRLDTAVADNDLPPMVELNKTQLTWLGSALRFYAISTPGHDDNTENRAHAWDMANDIRVFCNEYS